MRFCIKSITLLAISLLATPFQVQAIELPIPNLDDLVTPALRKQGVRLAGVLSAHRPMQPATPLGSSVGNALGIEAFLEAQLVQIPQGFYDALAEAGVSSSFNLRSLPVLKLQAHKAIGSRLDLGASYFGFLDYKIYGGDLKWTVFLPEEGPTWALRLCYAQSQLSYFSVKSWSPQLLVSRRLHFADAYLGAEYTWMTGRLKGSQTIDTGGGPVTTSIDIRGIQTFGASTFLGLSLRVPGIGLKLMMEGAYSFVGAHSLGAALGLSW